MAMTGVDPRAHRYFVGVVAAFFVFVVGWTVTTKDPVGDLRLFFAGPRARQVLVPLPVPPPLDAVGGRVAPGDRAAFVEAYDALRSKPREAGELFWPLLGRYPDLRPSLAHRYFTLASTAFQENRTWAARELALMAVEVDPKDHRSHELLAQIAQRLGRGKELARHAELHRTSRPLWAPPPPRPDWGVITLFLMGFFTVTAALYAYRDRIGLQAMIDEKVLGIGPRPDLDELSEDGSPTTIQNLDELRAVRKEKKKTITAILSAEAFLKDIQDAFDQKLYEKGVDMCAKAVELNAAHSPKVSAMCLAEGIRLFEIGDYGNARELLEVSLHFEPHTLEAHTCLGNCFIKLGDFDHAKVQYEKVIEVDPNNSSAYYTLGVCYQKVNDLHRAKRAFQVAVQLDDTHANCHFYLAKLHEAEKDYPGAIQHWKRFVELKPDSPHAAAAQERLGKLASLAGAS